jgi:hypothetical protein
LLLAPGLTGAVVFGCIPGVVVLMLAVSGHMVVQERRRRQIVFLPSFRRGGSSIIQGKSNGSQPRHGEPSTVDAPHTPSGHWPTGEVIHSDGSNGSNKV